MEDLSFLNFSIRDKTYLKQEDTLPSLSFPALIPTILPKKVIFSSSTSSPVNLPICFYLLPDPPLPHFPYSWWTALQSSPASSSPRTLLMAALSLSLSFSWGLASLREGVSCPRLAAPGVHVASCLWAMRDSQPTVVANLEDLLTPCHSLPPTGSSHRMQHTTTYCTSRSPCRGMYVSKQLSNTDLAFLGGHPTLGHTATRVHGTFIVNSSLMSVLAIAAQSKILLS